MLTGVNPNVVKSIFPSLLCTLQNLPDTLRHRIIRKPGTTDLVNGHLSVAPSVRQDSIWWCFPFIFKRLQLKAVRVKEPHTCKPFDRGSAILVLIVYLGIPLE